MAFTLAFDAPSGQPLTLDDMASLPPEAWPALQVSLAPSVQQLLCHFNTLALWRASKEESAFPPSQALALAHICLVASSECVPLPQPGAGRSLRAGRMVTTGWNFSELCEQLQVTYAEGAPLQAVTWLKQWIQDGLLERRAP